MSDDDRTAEILREILEDDAHNRGRLSHQDRTMIADMVAKMQRGSRGVFLVVNPDNSIDFMITNDSIVGAIGMLSRWINLATKRLEKRGDR